MSKKSGNQDSSREISPTDGNGLWFNICCGCWRCVLPCKR